MLGESVTGYTSSQQCGPHYLETRTRPAHSGFCKLPKSITIVFPFNEIKKA